MRRFGGATLAALAALALLAALIGVYTERALFSSDRFADRAASALGNEAVAAEIGRRSADQLIEADPDLTAVRPVLEQVVAGVVHSRVFRDLFRTGVKDLHRAVFERDRNTVTLTLADIGATARGAIAALNPRLARKIEANTPAEIFDAEPPLALTEAARIAHHFKSLIWILLGIAAVLIAAALWISSDRRFAVLVAGATAAIAAAVAIAVLQASEALLLGQIEAGGERDAVAAIWEAYLGDLRAGLFLFAGAGAVVAAAASSLLRPVEVRVPLRRAWDLIATAPERPALRVLRAAGLLAAGIIVLVRPEAVLHLAAVVAGLLLAYVGAAELMRMTLAASTTRATVQRRGWRTLAVTGVAALLIIVAAGVFVGTGGADEDPAPIETRGCNGSEQLCERRLDEVALAATHNAMSAVTYPKWLFAQQDAGLGDQLRDGVRALLIDAHYGQPTENGTVKTDLSELDRGERKTYVEAIGPDALDAALRIRDRLVDSKPVGEPGVYLCHRFCELGAIPIERGFAEIRDFLAANPHEAIVVVIEDYVDPEDIEAAVESSGLIDYVYTGPVDPLPTLEEMITSGGRALILAENDAGHGSIPWYHEAYEALTQETPYSFKQPKLLIERKRLRGSCAPNRGPDDAPLFLLNHWIDTSPAPRPSNAAKVNAREALMRRIRRCERLRQPVNLVAVDFYRRGDLFEVVDELNQSR